MKQLTGECPDLETIAAYLDGRLTDRERARVTAHLADCEDCYALFSESARVVIDEPTVAVPWHTRLKATIKQMRPAVAAGWTGTVLATAAALTMFVQTGQLARLRSSDSNLQALVAAVGTDRPFDARLSGFAYGPVRGPVRSGESSSAPAVSPDVRIAAAQIEKMASGSRTPQSLKALGVAYLVLGDVNRAVPVLEEAADLATRTRNAHVLAGDLPAAYLARATRNSQPQDFANALTAAERAVKLDPRLAEGWFNRACALERLSLADEARQAWQDYLKVDDRSGWAEEARSRMKVAGVPPNSGSVEDDRREVDHVADGAAGTASINRLVRALTQANALIRLTSAARGMARLILSGRSGNGMLAG